MLLRTRSLTQNKMTTLLKIGSLLLIAGLLYACSEDSDTQEVTSQEVSVTFPAGKVVSEDQETLKVSITLNKPAPQSGSLVLEVDGDTERFSTTPEMQDNLITVPFQKGNLEISFYVNPIDNTTKSGNETLTFKVHDAPGFLTFGSQEFTVVITDNETTSTAVFVTVEGSVVEGDEDGFELMVALSHEFATDKQLKITLENPELVSFIESGLVFDANGVAILEVPTRISFLIFNVKGIDDALLKGHKELVFKLSTLSDDITIGSENQARIQLIDDELQNKPKGYQIEAGNWRISEEYVYNESGKVSELHWRRELPNLTTGVTYYEYDEATGLISHIQYHPEFHEYFTIENGKITKSETYQRGKKTAYYLLDYENNRIVGKQYFNIQDDGSFAESLVFLYLYYTDGNLYKQVTYVPDSKQAGEYVEVGYMTYADYLNNQIVFPGHEIVPTMTSQTRLHRTYEIMSGGVTQSYTLSYEFDSAGRLAKRYVNNTNEVAIYSYY